MMAHYSTDEVIEELIVATYGKTGSERQKHVYREALHSLVRLAKAEQMRDMRVNVQKLTGAPVLDLDHHGETK